MKNTFYFTLKALFVLEIFTFMSQLFGYVKKGLAWKDESCGWFENVWLHRMDNE